MSLAARIARIEAAAQVDVGSRGIASFIIPGELAAAASSLASSITSGGLAIFTGFPCVTGHVIPTENDGLAGAVAIARAALALGKPTVHFVTDDVNAAPVRACADWLLSLGRTMGQDWSPSITVNAFPSPSSPPSPSAPSCDALHRLVTSCTHAVAIERTGRAADGSYYTMRGRRMDEMVAPIDDAFAACAQTIGIGDGGNELGMGKVRDRVIAGVPNGSLIACSVPSTHLITVGVSNWGGYALAASLALMCNNGPASPLPTRAQEEDLYAAIATAGARDGITGLLGESVDGLPNSVHFDKLEEIIRLASEKC